MSAPSAQQLVFEGPDPERLLLEAWSIHGTQVRFSEPVVVRRGGIGGFFAKAHYRIEVVPTTPGETGADLGGARPAETSVPQSDEALETVVASPYGATARPAHTAQPAGTDAPAAPLLPFLPPDAPPPRPPLPPIPAELAPAASAPPVPSGPADAGARRALADLVATTEDEVNLHSSPRPSFDEVLGKVVGSLGDDPAGLAAAVPATARSVPAGPGDAAIAGASTPSAGDGRVLPSRPWDDAAADGLAGGAPAGAGRSASEALREQLTLVGFPNRVLAEAPTAPRSLAEAFALAPTPRPLPRTPGSLIAVVGSLAVARGVAAQVGLPPGEIGRARRARAIGEAPSPFVVHDEQEARDLAPGWRRDRVGVAAVMLSSFTRDGAWARAMLRAMAPSMTIALASATMKGEDVLALCNALGGVDALVVEDLEATLTPAAILGTGIPVGMLDGVAADPASWSAIAARALARRSVVED